MVAAMRRAWICIIVTMLVSAGAVVGGARAASASRSRAPTRAQIRHAVRRAERSRYLWATVNICRSHGHRGGLVGIRGEMGALGFRSTLSMTIRLRQYDRSRRRYVPLKGATATRTVRLGPLRRGIHQDGAEFRFSSQTGRLDAQVTFSWTRGRRRLGIVTRATTSGHHTAAFAQPARYSAAHCTL